MNCRESILVGVLIAWLSVPAGARTRKNLVYNSSFELESNGLPEGWQWSEGKAKARLKVDHGVSHSGHSSVKLTNPSPEAPQVYGLLRQTIQLQAGQTYTLSCYVQSNPASSRISPVGAWFGGGHQWLLRKSLPANPEGWQRVALTFTAKPEDARFDLIIVTDSVTDGLWIDDVQLESGVAATDYESNKPLQPGQVVLSLQPVGDRENLLPNSSFEVVDGNRPKYYVWDPRNTDATMVIDASVARSGAHSLRLTNGTQFGPHIYGLVSLQEGARVKPHTNYTFSCYVKGEHTGIAWFGGAAGWLIRASFPRETGGKWARVVRTFTTGDEEQIPVLIVTENPTAPVWVDDIQLVEGNTPAPYFLEEGVKHPVFELAFSPPAEAPEIAPRPAWNSSKYPPDQFTFTGSDLWAEGILYVPDPVKQATVEVSLQEKNGRVLAEGRRTEDLPRGAQAVEFGWNSGTAIGGDLRLSARLLTPEVAASSEVNTRLITTAEVEEILKRDEALRAKMRKHLAGLKKVGKDPSYPQVTLTLLDNFINYSRDDLKRGEVARAYDAAGQMEAMGKRSLEAKGLPPVPRFVAPQKGRPFRIAGSSFLGTVRWPEGRLQANREIQFVGHGHFGQVRSDVEKFPGYGVNILQVEFGPNSILPSENDVNLQAVDDFLKLCDRAQKSGVAVNLLISPHYFPGWAMDKWPFLGDCTGGFLRYCIHAPESRSVLEKFLRVVIPRIKDHPALHSLCLSNEPLSIDSAKCRYMARFWHDWLVKEHGNVGKLNEIWGKKYGSIEEIAVPEARMDATPITYDFMRCNCDAHAGFHRWMADLIHEMAPDLPVHAKIMMSAHFARHQYGPWCVDPELFADLSQINGNDCCKWYSREGDWAANFIGENMGYDFQRSVGDLPVFNSENHIITDRDQDYVAPDYIRNVYWQGAVHGQSATTTWVWERAFDPRSDFAGSIMHRPECVEALGQTGLDLMRLAPEVAALQKLPPQVVLLWSIASLVKGEEHVQALGRVYTALNACGVKIGFVTERQLKSFADTGELPLPLRQAKVLIVPCASRTPDSSLKAMALFQDRGGKVMLLSDCLQEDEYGRARAVEGEWASLPDTPKVEEFWGSLLDRLPGWGVDTKVQVTRLDGKPVWGVEWLAAEREGKPLVNLTNYRNEAVQVRVTVKGKQRTGRNLLDGRDLSYTFTLPSLRPVLWTPR